MLIDVDVNLTINLYLNGNLDALIINNHKEYSPCSLSNI